MHFWDKTYLLSGTGKTPDMPRTSTYKVQTRAQTQKAGIELKDDEDVDEW